MIFKLLQRNGLWHILCVPTGEEDVNIWAGEEVASPHVEVAEQQRSGGAGGLCRSRWPQGSGAAASPSKAGVSAGDFSLSSSPPPVHLLECQSVKVLKC